MKKTIGQSFIKFLINCISNLKKPMMNISKQILLSSLCILSLNACKNNSKTSSNIIEKIDDWNFRWQYFYTFRNILHLPAGSLIKVEAIFDNTLNNMDNPFNPPQFISGENGSMKTTDEMLQLIVSYLPYQEGDENLKLE